MQHLKASSLLQGEKYKIESVLGQGGFGITYLATQVLLDRKVCIKEFFFKEYCERNESTSHITLGTQSSHEIVERFMSKFLKEARTISQLDHPNIIRIHDIFMENNTAYYVMEYIEGESLSDIVNKHGALHETKAVDYIRQVADALDFVHKRSINHLDVKPANIMVRHSDNKAILIDFGLSKQYDEQGGQTSTTPVGISHGYAPMEQYKQGGVSTFTPQTDIYALGATLYKLVTGNTPPQAMDILDEGLPSLPTSLSSPVAETIKKAMQPRKTDRPKTITELLDTLSSSAAPKASQTDPEKQSQQSRSTDEATRIIEDSSIRSDKETASNETAKEWEPVTISVGEEKKKKNWLKWIVIIAILGFGGYYGVMWVMSYTYTVSENNRFNADYQKYRSLIEEGDELYALGRYYESKKKYEEAQNYERLYYGTHYSIEFQTDIENKIREAYKLEQEYIAEQKRLEQESAAAKAEQERREAEYRRTHGTINGHEYADLGLSVKWATCNVGAYSPEIYGTYYEWCAPDWGGTWRLPTKDEYQELMNKCTWYWTQQGGKYGCEIVGPNGNSIFLPTAGYQIVSIFNEGTTGCYWTYNASTQSDAYNLKFDKNSITIDSTPQRYGLTIRLVSY